MYRSDGQPAAHPTFSLVLASHKKRTALQGQGRFTLSLVDIDPTMSAQEFHDAMLDESLKEKLFSRLQMHASNVPGTDQNWKSSFWEFRATSFFLRHMEQHSASMFHTGSVSDFHDPFLRIVMANYVRKLDGHGDEAAEAVLTSESAFNDSVHKYKHVITNYLAAKMEIWHSLFLRPVHDVVKALLTMEFGSSRGAIHFHELAYHRKNSNGNDTVESMISTIIADLSDDVVAAIISLDEFISDTYTPSELFPTSPTLVLGKKIPGNKRKVLSDG